VAKVSKGWAFIAVFFGIIGFVLALIFKFKDKYVMYYAKQSLVIVITGVILSIIGWIPILGWIVVIIGSVVLLILWIIAWVNAISGKQRETPLIGKYAAKFKF
jgi:uncharacterized membrane protein